MEIIQQNAFDIFSDEESPSKPKKPKKQPKQPKPPKPPKSPTLRRNSNLPSVQRNEFGADKVIKCCQICHPGNTETAPGIGQSNFDKILSTHMFEVHNIEDDVYKFRKYNTKLRKQLNDENHAYKDKIMKCLLPGCNFQYPITQYQANLHRIARHVEYHNELKQAGKNILVEIDQLNLEEASEHVLFPCPDCDVEPFATYSELNSHRNRNHADFTFYCRDRACTFKTWVGCLSCLLCSFRN